MTLIELIVVLVLLGILATLVGGAVAGARQRPAATEDSTWRIGRLKAVRDGRRVTVWSPTGSSGQWALVTFLPDGRALGPGVDPLTGALRERDAP